MKSKIIQILKGYATDDSSKPNTSIDYDRIDDLATDLVKLFAIPVVMPRFLDFGDYGIIEQKRYGVDNEKYTHKIIDRLRSNTWVDVPVQSPAKETHHDHMEDVLRCVCCGVSETEVLKYRVIDVKPNGV